MGRTVFLWLNVPCHAPAPGKGVQGTRGVHWAAPRGGVQVGGVHAPAPRILYDGAGGQRYEAHARSNWPGSFLFTALLGPRH